MAVEYFFLLCMNPRDVERNKAPKNSPVIIFETDFCKNSRHLKICMVNFNLFLKLLGLKKKTYIDCTQQTFANTDIKLVHFSLFTLGDDFTRVLFLINNYSCQLIIKCSSEISTKSHMSVLNVVKYNAYIVASPLKGVMVMCSS